MRHFGIGLAVFTVLSFITQVHTKAVFAHDIQARAFYQIASTATCEYANDELYTGAEIWEGSKSGDYLEMVLEKMYTDQGNYEDLDSYFQNYINNITDGSYAGTCATFDAADSNCGTIMACSSFDAPEQYYILRAFGNLQTQLVSLEQKLLWETSLYIYDIVAIFGTSLLQPLGDEAGIATMFADIRTALGAVSPALGLFPETAFLGGILGVARAISAAAGTADTPEDSDSSDMVTLLENRLNSCFGVYASGLAAVAHAIWTTGDISSFPGWVYGNTDHTNNIVNFFSEGRYSKSYSSYEQDLLTASLGPLINRALIGLVLKSAHVYVLVGAHSEDTCDFSGSVWQNDECYGLEYAGAGPGASTDTDDISVSTTRMSDDVITGFNTHNLSTTDVINNAVACQTARNAYDGNPTIGQDPADYDPYPECFFNLPVIYVGPFDSSDGAYSHSPCKIRENNEDNDNSTGVGNFLPDQLASKFTYEWCTASVYCTVVCTYV